MRKIMISIMAMMMVIGLMVSCDNANVIPEQKVEELVSVSFDEGTSRGLTGSIEAFDKNQYYWKYAAKKADDSGLISGQTPSYNEQGAAWIKKGTDNKSGGKGLDGTISGFSQGYWNFTLYAYTDIDGNNLAYSGEITGQKLQKSETGNTVVVRVAPITTGNGSLLVDTAKIRLVPNQNSSLTDEQLATFSKVVIVEKFVNGNVSGSPSSPISEGTTEYSLEAGTYKVTVKFVRNDELTYAEGYAIATVYSNVKTIVSGYLDEITTDASFASDAEVINKTVVSESIAKASINNISTDVKVEKTPDDLSVTDTKVSAVVPANAAKSVLNNAITNSEYANAEGSSSSVSLSLNVNTTEATSSSVTLEIGLDSIVTTTIDANVHTEITPVKALEKYVTVTVQMQSGLSNVAIKHTIKDENGNDVVKNMISVNSSQIDELDDEQLSQLDTNGAGVFFYNINSGLLTIKTKSFSPFEVSYDPFIAQIGLIKYATIQDAIDAAPAGEQTTITLLTDVKNGGGFGFWNDNDRRKDKDIILDLNNCTYTFEGPAVGSKGFETQAMHLEKGNTLYIKNGTLDIVEDNTAIKMLIQNYCNLSLNNVTVDGTNLNGRYTLSNNCGNVIITGKTILKAPAGGVAFDVYYWAQYYPEGVSVILDKDFKGYIYGNIEYDADTVGISLGDVASKATLTILAGYNQGTINNEIKLGSSIDEANTGITISGGKFKIQPNQNFMVFPYTTSLNSQGYYLVFGDREKIETELQNNSTFKFDRDIHMNGTAPGFGNNKAGFIVDGGEVDGNNNSLYVYDAKATNDCAIFVKQGTIKNLTIKYGFRGIYMEQPTGDILIDNVIIDGNSVYTLNQNCTKSDYSVTVKNSILNGWTSHSEAVLFTYENCSFGKGGPWNMRYAYFRPYGNTIVKNCNFSEGYVVDSSEIKGDEYLILIDCHVGETLITQENVITLLGNDAKNITVTNTTNL